MAASLSRDLKGLVKGEVLDDAAAREARSGDFGRMVKRVPGVVVRPAGTDDVAAVLRYARKHSVPVATRGEAHTQTGQALTDGGIALDLTSLHAIHGVDTGTPGGAGPSADCGAGVKWETLVRQVVPRGLVPPVLTNNLGVTIGGTLSVAGLGVASFRHGAQGDNVLEIEAVTGAGDVVRCSPSQNQEVWDAVRSGLGQFGVITRARLKLRSCLTKTRTYYLLYDDLAAIMRDMQMVIDQDRVDYLESWCVPCPQGFRWTGPTKEAFAAWFFPLHLTVEFDPASPPDDAARLQGLQPYRKMHVEDQDLFYFAARLEPLFAVWNRSGYWANTHPWMETILPWPVSLPYITQVLNALPPTALGGGHVLLWPCRGTTSSVPLFMTPKTPLVMGFGILPGLPPDILPLVKPRLNAASDASMQAGAKRYLSGLIEFDRPRWKQHFGPKWDDVCRLKKTYDPDGILNPGFIDYGP
ncbi:MAG TPA: FAD-binding protein [Candidatus Polarisedimenticolia bacterium]|nr:FAD-binding protein [Candidatus Polarisedimenticolia bacterium]